MSISTTTVWEVRPTVGSDNNGGGFVPGSSGTDWSQQTAAQYALTGIATSGAGAVFLTASAAADMVGNILQVISGTNFTTGFFQVTSVSVGVSVTVDRNICTGVGASGVINIGGSLATIQIIVPVYLGGNTIYIKASGSLTITSSMGQFNNNLYIIGYTTTRGDNGKATITTATNSIPLFTIGQEVLLSLYNLTLTNTATIRAATFNNANAGYNFHLTIVNCVVDGASTLLNISNAGLVPLVLINTEIKNCTGSGIGWAIVNPFHCIILYSYIHDNATDGIDIQSQTTNLRLEWSVVKSNTIGIHLEGTGAVGNNIIIVNSDILNNSSDGLKQSGAGAFSEVMVIHNCIIDSNGGWGLNFGSGTVFFGDYRNNAFRANTSGNYQNITTVGDVTLTGDPFTNRGAGDFTLNSTAGAGAACKAAGYQSTIL